MPRNSNQKKPPVQRRTRKVEVDVEPDLADAAHAKAKRLGINLPAVVRAFLRHWVADGTEEPPPGTDYEMRRAPREKSNKKKRDNGGSG